MCDLKIEWLSELAKISKDFWQKRESMSRVLCKNVTKYAKQVPCLWIVRSTLPKFFQSIDKTQKLETRIDCRLQAPMIGNHELSEPAITWKPTAPPGPRLLWALSLSTSFVCPCSRWIASKPRTSGSTRRLSWTVLNECSQRRWSSSTTSRLCRSSPVNHFTRCCTNVCLHFLE